MPVRDESQKIISKTRSGIYRGWKVRFRAQFRNFLDLAAPRRSLNSYKVQNGGDLARSGPRFCSLSHLPRASCAFPSHRDRTGDVHPSVVGDALVHPASVGLPVKKNAEIRGARVFPHDRFQLTVECAVFRADFSTSVRNSPHGAFDTSSKRTVSGENSSLECGRAVSGREKSERVEHPLAMKSLPRRSVPAYPASGLFFSLTSRAMSSPCVI